MASDLLQKILEVEGSEEVDVGEKSCALALPLLPNHVTFPFNSPVRDSMQV